MKKIKVLYWIYGYGISEELTSFTAERLSASDILKKGFIAHKDIGLTILPIYPQ